MEHSSVTRDLQLKKAAAAGLLISDDAARKLCSRSALAAKAGVANMAERAIPLSLLA